MSKIQNFVWEVRTEVTYPEGDKWELPLVVLAPALGEVTTAAFDTAVRLLGAQDVARLDVLEAKRLGPTSAPVR